jgi:hypothetical protein
MHMWSSYDNKMGKKICLVPSSVEVPHEVVLHVIVKKVLHRDSREGISNIMHTKMQNLKPVIIFSLLLCTSDKLNSSDSLSFMSLCQLLCVSAE